MKIGLILECGPEGADKQVCEHLVRMRDETIEISSVTLNNKPGLIRDCGPAAANLFAEGCDRVVIVWDLYPAWREDRAQPCRHEDREAILVSLRSAGVSSTNVYLVCIEEELEAWLLADERALTAILSRTSHPKVVRHINNTERVQNPKKRLNKLFQDAGRGPYVDHIHAIQIARQLSDFRRLRRCATCGRFIEKATEHSI